MNWNTRLHNAARPLTSCTRSMKRITWLMPCTKPALVNGSSMALAFLFLLTVPLMAQEQPPVDVTGTQVATEQTPAAATNSDELRKAAQNPIASLISVPVQNIDNFGIGPADRTQNIVNIQPVIPLSAGEELEPDHSLDCAHHLSTDSRAAAAGGSGANHWGQRVRRHEPFILPLAEEEQDDLGHRADVCACLRRPIRLISGRGNSAWGHPSSRWCSPSLGRLGFLQTTSGL